MMLDQLMNTVVPVPARRRKAVQRRRGSSLLRNTNFVRGAFGLIAAVTDVSAILVSAFVATFVYHLAVYGEGSDYVSCLPIGVEIALLFLVQNIYGADYALTKFLTFKGHFSRSFAMWTIAFLAVLALGFLTRNTEVLSRGGMLAFYVGGWALLALARSALVRIVRETSADGTIAARRVFLVGREDEVEGFLRNHDAEASASRVIASLVLREGRDTFSEDLELAVAAARMTRPDDIFVLVPWAQRETIDACLDAFVQIPAAIHLAPERVLDRFLDARIAKIGSVPSLQLVRGPLTPMEIVAKRLLDIVGASAALLLLSPLFLVVALLIKADSRGPVLFKQRRYGFNREAFRIVKFRSMTTLDDGSVVRQAQRNDRRVTRVGAWLRRLSIDELPQLLNVLRGDMSLVGPRPHALAHDKHFETRIALYARRHNVKPGITGWAQVNGFRGETNTDDKMRGRVAHDLYYIDNWSLWLDLRILVMTVVSPKTFRNAY